MKPVEARRRSRFGPSLVWTMLFGGLVLAPTSTPAAQTEPSPAPRPKTHSERMEEKLPPGLSTDLGDRLHNQLFDVEAQIRATRQAIGRNRAALLHRKTTESDEVRLASYRHRLEVLADVKQHLAATHVEVAECIAECARAERAVAENEDAETGPHLEKMAARARSAQLHVRALHEAVGTLRDLQAEAKEPAQDELVASLSKECESLRQVVAVCAESIDDGGGHEEHSKHHDSGPEPPRKD